MHDRLNSGRPDFGRRDVLNIVLAAASVLPAATPPLAEAQQLRSGTTFDPNAIKAVLFDIQGTTVDYYSTIMRAGETMAEANGIQADWAQVIDEWRAEYRRELDRVIAGTISWRSTDQIYRHALDVVLESHDWGRMLDGDDRDRLTAAWSELEPWPDTVAGLRRLRRRYILSTLSNGSMASVVRIAKRGGLPFDCILTAELVRSAKPDPKVYELAQNSLALQPQQLLLVACHKYDLKAAKALGFRVAFVPRPQEFGPNKKVDTKAERYFDLMPENFTDLADELGA